MPTSPDLRVELLKVRPEAKPVRIGQHEVIRGHDETPIYRFETVYKFLDGPRLIELTALNSYDGKLARFLLDSLQGRELPALGSGRIRVFAANYPKPWLFECVAIVPPKIARRFDHQSTLLRRFTYWVVPSFAGEFRNGEDADGFWLQIFRKDGWNVTPTRWNRSRKTGPVWD